MHIGRRFFWLFAVVFVVQLILWVLYRHFGFYGLEKPASSGSFTPFGELYIKIYLIPLMLWIADFLHVGGGLGLLGFLCYFGPLAVAMIYAAMVAFVLSFRRTKIIL